MKVLHLNEDPYDWDGIKEDYFVTQYTNECYEGSGTAYSYSTENDVVSQYNIEDLNAAKKLLEMIV